MEFFKKHYAFVLLFFSFVMLIGGFVFFDGGENFVQTRSPEEENIREKTKVSPTIDKNNERDNMNDNTRPEMSLEEGKDYRARLITSKGGILIDLDEEKAPITVNNFVYLSKQGYYNDILFHRVIDNFMIQSGDPEGTGAGGPGYTLPSEADNGLTHDRGVIATAKRGGAKEMSGSQFYIVQSEQGAHYLDGEYTVFGKVLEGMEVVDEIAQVETDSRDRPLKDIELIKVEIE